MQTNSLQNDLLSKQNLNALGYLCTDPLFVWSPEAQKIAYFNNAAKSFFSSLGLPDDFEDINKLLVNWEETPTTPQHLFWYQFRNSEDMPLLLQVRNSLLDQDEDWIASVVIGDQPEVVADSTNSVKMNIVDLCGDVFCSRTDFLENFPRFLNQLQIEMFISELGFFPSEAFEPFGLVEPLNLLAAEKSFTPGIEKIIPRLLTAEHSCLQKVSMLITDYCDPEEFFVINNSDNVVLGVFVLDPGRADEKQIKTVFLFLTTQFISLFEKMEITKSLYQNIFENSLNAMIIEHISEGVIITNNEYHIMYINPISSLMFGYGLNDVVGRKIDDLLITSDGMRSFLSVLDEDDEREEATEIKSLHRREGTVFPCQVRHCELTFDADNLYHIFLLNDVTENEERRMKTEQLSQRAFLGDFASMLAHEIRNPINNIRTWVEIIKSKSEHEGELRSAANRIEDDCLRMSQLVDNILSFSRPMKLQLEEIDFPMFIGEIVERWKINFARANINCYYTPPAEFPQFFGDIRSLEQVFNNLIGNAIDAFDGKGGVITLKLSVSQPVNSRKQIMVSVSDNGPGIPDDKIDHIFEPFVTTKKKGNGWGLALVKRIVTSHKGTIQVKSFPGGTVFEIYLPAVDGV